MKLKFHIEAEASIHPTEVVDDFLGELNDTADVDESSYEMIENDYERESVKATFTMDMERMEGTALDDVSFSIEFDIVVEFEKTEGKFVSKDDLAEAYIEDMPTTLTVAGIEYEIIKTDYVG